MEKKITLKDNYNSIIALAKENDRKDIIDFCLGRIEQLDKKAGSKKPSKSQLENEPIKARVLEILATSENGMTCSEVIKASADMRDYSTQKISGMMKILISEGKVEKVAEGKKSLFKLS